MTKQKEKQWLWHINRARRLKEKLSEARDNLRAEVEEMQTILDSMDETNNGLEIGIDQLHSALDEASEYV